MKKEFEFEKTIAAEDITDYLAVLVDAFNKGIVSFNTNEGSFVLKPEGMIHMEVEAVSKKDKEKFELKFSWHKETAVVEETEKGFSITAEDAEGMDIDNDTFEPVVIEKDDLAIAPNEPMEKTEEPAQEKETEHTKKRR